jgi:hypothetical protein
MARDEGMIGPPDSSSSKAMKSGKDSRPPTVQLVSSGDSGYRAVDQDSEEGHASLTVAAEYDQAIRAFQSVHSCRNGPYALVERVKTDVVVLSVPSVLNAAWAARGPWVLFGMFGQR